MNTCGSCVYYKADVNPDTGCVRPSRIGRCGWVYPEYPPEKWPTAFQRGDHGNRPHPIGVWRTTESDCPQWSAVANETGTRCGCHRMSAKEGD